MSPDVVFLIKSVLFLAGMGGALALLLVIADAWLADYGECTITINGEKELKVVGGDKLLNSLAENKIFIPSACGGRGTCAYCKVKVLEGGGPVLPMETPYLTAEELAAGVRLSCQVKVRNNLKIEIPEHLFNVREFRATVDRLTDLTHDIKEVRLKLIEPGTIRFKAGQYLQLRAPEYEGNKEAVYRAYSISSAPEREDTVELVIRLVPNGVCTTWVFNHLKEGDEVLFNGPYGDFFLRETDAEIVFVAGGSGFAPIKAMLEGHPDEIDRRGARFFFGARGVRDLFYRDVMTNYEAAHPNFRFIPALSAPAEGDNWDGESGLITEVLDRHIESPEDKEFYLCGSPGMIDACVKLFERKGVSPDVVFYDSFG